MLGKHPGVELLGHRTLHLGYWVLSKIFQIVCSNFYSQQEQKKVPVFLPSSSYLMSLVLHGSHLKVQWYISVVWLCYFHSENQVFTDMTPLCFHLLDGPSLPLPSTWEFLTFKTPSRRHPACEAFPAQLPTQPLMSAAAALGRSAVATLSYALASTLGLAHLEGKGLGCVHLCSLCLSLRLKSMIRKCWMSKVESIWIALKKKKAKFPPVN